MQFGDIDLLLLRAPTAALFKELFEAVVVNSDDAIKNEATFQYHVALALAELCRPADIRLEVRADCTRGDVLLVRKDGVLVLELKYVPVESLTLGERPLSELDDEELLLLPTTAQSSHMRRASRCWCAKWRTSCSAHSSNRPTRLRRCARVLTPPANTASPPRRRFMRGSRCSWAASAWWC
jgi:hypothetical protein